MELKRLNYDFTVCQVKSVDTVDFADSLYFIGRTDEEISLVCRTEFVPSDTVKRDDGWNGFKIQEVLDFSLIGILSKISGILAENKIGIFAVSTYNTDYIFVKKYNYGKALSALETAGYKIV